jgi:hypothetical protein
MASAQMVSRLTTTQSFFGRSTDDGGADAKLLRSQEALGEKTSFAAG